MGKQPELQRRFHIFQVRYTGFATYPRLLEALPSIQEDFFRLPLTDAERREIIQTCPRTEGINYSPPSINEVATTTIKKADTALYNTQSFLAQATRPIDYFVHKILHEIESIGSDDSRIIFAATMRAILSGAATMLTQGRVDNLHYGLNLQGKPARINQSEPDSLIDQETLEKLLNLKKANITQTRRPFRQRQQQAATPPLHYQANYTAMAQPVIPASIPVEHTQQYTNAQAPSQNKCSFNPLSQQKGVFREDNIVEEGEGRVECQTT
ncbi:hypothetical protein BB560_003508, partial [Smittium megazygosporum]